MVLILNQFNIDVNGENFGTKWSGLNIEVVLILRWSLGEVPLYYVTQFGWYQRPRTRSRSNITQMSQSHLTSDQPRYALLTRGSQMLRVILWITFSTFGSYHSSVPFYTITFQYIFSQSHSNGFVKKTNKITGLPFIHCLMEYLFIIWKWIIKGD